MESLLPFQDVFELKCLLDDINVKLSCRIENGVKQLLALVTEEGEILLYYTYGELCSVLKRVPWFHDANKSIQALCFDPSATWLLVVCLDGSLYIIPALSLVDKKQKVDCKWSIHDLTHFPKPPQVTEAKPTSLVWWQTLDCNQNALIGFENGNISLISLTDGRCFGSCAITETILQLNLFHDNSLDAVSLMINGVSGQQWKLVLEQHSIGYLWPPDANNLSDDASRSRLQNLRQLSAEKLAYFKQKFTENKHNRRDSSNSDSESVSSDNSHSGPELLPHLCDTHFSPQYAKNRYLFSAFYKPNCLVTVHSGDVESAPLYIHKLEQKTDYLLLTDRLIYTVNTDSNKLSILSSQLSECRLEGDSEFNKDSLIAQFTLSKENEKIVNVFKLTDNSLGKERRKRKEEENAVSILPKNVGDLLISRVKVDTCVMVTNMAVYKLVLKCSPVHKFISLIIDDSNMEKAEKLAVIFGLNLQRLFESCGDLLVSNGNFHQGLVLYKQAKIHILKRVLKLAVSADCKSLLKFIHMCLGSATRVDMSIGTKIHIGNLAVMAYTELLLRFSGSQRRNNIKDFLNFVCFEEYYDQVLAINVACQAGHWKVVTLLTKARGLQPETVVAISQILQTNRAPKPNDYDFLLAITEPSLLQSMLIYPTSCQIILNYYKDNLNVFPMDVLNRLLLQLDPSQPVALPLLHKLQLARMKKDTTSLDSLEDCLDFDPTPQMNCVLKEVIETFIFVLLVVNQRQSEEISYSLEYLERVPTPELLVEPTAIPKFPKLNAIDCGYEHIGVVRNNNLYMMGISTNGSLGLGPLLTQSSPIKLVSTLSELKVKVLTLSCGRKHTLALTDFGVYSWGSNYYGQLGLPPLVQETPYPQLITALNKYTIIDVQAGQYHSMALTSNGKVLTWGWGVHGQLGHGTSFNEYFPRLLDFNEPIMQISAGYAHSFILTLSGKLFGFGSNAFGQLEVCNIEGTKTTRPTWVLVMPDFYNPIENIRTSYFHNICTTSDQEVYVWGASPQEVRMSQSKSNQKLNGIEPKLSDSWKSCVKVYSSQTKKAVDEISVGFKYSAVLHNGRIAWGKSKEIELMNQSTKKETTLVPKYIHVASGYDYVLAIEHSGKLVAWGNTTFAQKMISKQQGEDCASSFLTIRNTKGRCLKVVNTKEGSLEAPIEIPGLPTITISYDVTDHRQNPKKFAPFAVRSIENPNYSEKQQQSPVTRQRQIPDIITEETGYKTGQKTLHYTIEAFSNLYDYENVLAKCIELQNYQAAAKVALIDEHFSDSLTFQLKALKNYMDTLDLEYNINIVPCDDISKKNDINTGKVVFSNSESSPARVLSNSSSLDSIRQWGEEEEHQGGCESPCEFTELGDVRQNMSQYVKSFKNDTISTVSRIISSQPTYPEVKSNEFDFEVHIKNPNTRKIINYASNIVEFYIKKTYATENHILMQNILMKCIEFWLSNNLPVCVLEKVLLKNMDKYFYPLSILLFCKNFCGNGDKNEVDPKGFLKDFSTKFCLQLCSMVLENVNKA